MCGITGFANPEAPLPPDAVGSVLGRMCDVIRHRGPDDQGSFVTEGVALGMRRLSIIDLVSGHQPISNEDGTLTIVFNGEIYNYRELRSRLQGREHRFRTQSDTEAIVHAYETYGPGCLRLLRGMFAFAIWDAKARRLFLARDRVGKKPMYYTLTLDGTLVFGSELKSLLEYPGMPRVLDPAALDAYLTLGYVAEPLSIFRGVYKLPPGHYLTFERGKVHIEQYWDFPYGEPAAPEAARPAEDLAQELRQRLEDAVRVRMISDVPLGAFLSGGIDSATVVGLMSCNSSRPVRTFSIGFREDSFNELKYARIAAKHFATDHEEFVVTPEICQVVDELVWHFDEPFADSSAIPTYMVSKLARQRVTVALSGDGGDELFAGYTRYVVDRRRDWYGQLPRAFRTSLRGLSRWLPHGARGRNFLHNVTLEPMDRYQDSVAVFTALNKRLLYSGDFRAQLPSDSAIPAEILERTADLYERDPVHALLYLDSKTYLPGDILTKVDRMSMAVSLEARAPLLDQELIEFVTGLPSGLKLRGSDSKHILKRAVRDLVPSQILERSKQGFGVPVQEWLNHELRERIRETLREPRTRQRGYVAREYVDLLLEEHACGRRDHSVQLWALFMLELWHRRYCDGAASDSPIQTPAVAGA